MSRTIDAVQIDGAKLRKARLEHCRDIGEVARRSGIHRDHISRLERQEWTGGSRPSTVRKLAAAIGVEPGELLAEED
jgi:predicted transcriptional regulator